MVVNKTLFYIIIFIPFLLNLCYTLYSKDLEAYTLGETKIYELPANFSEWEKEPDTSLFIPIARIPAGRKVRIKEIKGKWAKVGTGWVPSRYLFPEINTMKNSLKSISENVLSYLSSQKPSYKAIKEVIEKYFDDSVRWVLYNLGLAPEDFLLFISSEFKDIDRPILRYLLYGVTTGLEKGWQDILEKNFKASKKGKYRGLLAYIPFDSEEEIEILNIIVSNLPPDYQEKIVYATNIGDVNVLYVPGSHDPDFPISFIAIPIRYLDTEEGTISFKFSAKWNLLDNCPKHFILGIVSDISNILPTNKGFLEFSYLGGVDNRYFRLYIAEVRGLTNERIDWKWISTAQTPPEPHQYLFYNNTWYSFKLVWSRKGDLFNNAYISLYINEEIVGQSFFPIQGNIPLDGYLYIGIPLWEKGPRNAFGFFDDLFIWNQKM